MSNFNKMLKNFNANSISIESTTDQAGKSAADQRLDSMFNLDKDAKGESKNIALSDITPNPKNIRKGDSWKNEGDMKTLIESIESTGLQQNLVVRKKYENEAVSTNYVLLSGHRRYEALKILHERYPQDIAYSHPLCWVLYVEDNELLNRDTYEELAIISTNVEVRSLTNEEMLEAILIYEKAYDEIRQKALKLKKEVIDPVTGEPNRELTPKEQELLSRQGGRVRDFVAKSMNIGARKVSNLKLLNKKLIKPLLEAFKRDELQIRTGLTLANEGVQVQKAFMAQNTKPLSEVSKQDVECFAKAFKEGKKLSVGQIPEGNIKIAPKADLQKRVKKLYAGEIEISSDDYGKYIKYKENIEKELKKIEKLLNRYE